jgi:hypothetical protein
VCEDLLLPHGIAARRLRVIACEDLLLPHGIAARRLRVIVCEGGEQQNTMGVTDVLQDCREVGVVSRCVPSAAVCLHASALSPTRHSCVRDVWHVVWRLCGGLDAELERDVSRELVRCDDTFSL